ncbi:MAG: DUF58 domain-containing protein, partial [Halobacteria archaeon]
LSYGIYSRLDSLPQTNLEIEREYNKTPYPGEEVQVTVKVTNVGREVAKDLRIIDGVPEELAVVEGNPRAVMYLPPGVEDEFSYSIEANRGEFTFDELKILNRNVSGSELGLEKHDLSDSIRCGVEVDSLPVRSSFSRRAGRNPSKGSGEGIEFHSARRYQPGDSVTSIDWRRYSRTRELTTISYQEDRSGTIQILIDARPENRLAETQDSPNALEYMAYAAERIYLTLVERGNQVGLSLYPYESISVEWGNGPSHQVEVREELRETQKWGEEVRRTDTDLSSLLSMNVRKTMELLPDTAQVVLVSPLLDSRVLQLTRYIDSCGSDTVVVSPDITGDGTVGGLVEDVDRNERLLKLRSSGIEVVDWDVSDPLSVEIEKAVKTREVTGVEL